MAEPGSSQGGTALIAALVAAGALAVWVDRQRTEALKAAGVSEDVKLYQEAVAAVDEASKQIHAARRAAEALSAYEVTFDVRSRLDESFTEPLPPLAEPKPTPSPKRIFTIEEDGQWPKVREMVDRLLAPRMAENVGDQVEARPTLLNAINVEGGIWTAGRALALLEGLGWTTESARPINVVGNVLSTMYGDGDIAKVGRGEYTSLMPRTSLADGPASGIQAAPGAWIFSDMSDEGG